MPARLSLLHSARCEKVMVNVAQFVVLGQKSASQRIFSEARRAPRRHDRRYPSPVRSSSRTALEGEPLDLRGLRRRQFVLGRARREFVELKCQLVEKTLLALRALAVKLAPQRLDRQLQEGDLRRRRPTPSPRRSRPVPRPPQAPSSVPGCRTHHPPAGSNHST